MAAAYFDLYSLTVPSLTPSIHVNMAEFNSSPKEKWNILRTLIREKKLNVQHRRQHTFGLFKSRKMEKCEISDMCSSCNVESVDNYIWLEYMSEEFPQYRLAVRQRVRSVNWNDAIGFDNTGNICIWPSEEILSYLCIKNCRDFRDKTVCEVGAGMTGLAGMMLAVASDAKEVIITDGNIDSVRKLMVMENKNKYGGTIVKSKALMWNKKEDYSEYQSYFDYVICADCLFNEEAHKSLLDVLCTLLKCGGQVIILSPLRGNRIERFIQQGKRTFEIEEVQNYDDYLCSLYMQCRRSSPARDEGIKNFPIMLKLKNREDVDS